MLHSTHINQIEYIITSNAQFNLHYLINIPRID